MAANEKSCLLRYQDKDGNIHLLYPITSKEYVDGIEGIETTLNGLNNSAVKHTEQSLTEAQKEQARENIGAISEADVPQKGRDYWTEADQESIVQQVITAIGTPVFGRVDGDNTIILSGDLADGTYTIKYEDADGNLTDIGTLNTEGTPAYVNLVETAEAPDSTAIYNGIGYQHGYYISSGSGYSPDTTNGELSTATGLMPFTKGTTYYVKNGKYPSNYTPSRISLFDGNKTLLGQIKASEIASHGTTQNLNSDGSYFSFVLTGSASMIANAKYFAIVLCECYTAPIIATVDFENL